MIGAPGLQALRERLPALARDCGADLVVANGENARGGCGITAVECEALHAAGVHVITGGNHIWEGKDASGLLDLQPRLLRPANFPEGAPGSGWVWHPGIGSGTGPGGDTGPGWIVASLQGREMMTPIDCPFRKADAIIEAAHREHPGAPVVIDFHAESVDEKEALAWHLDGRVAVVAGTHTHVQTADERILPKGTGYITDLGMSGPEDSVIGVKSEICVRRSLTQMPIKMETAEGKASICGAAFRIDTLTGLCVGIERIRSGAPR